MNEIELKLHIEEVNSILVVLGDLPTKSNAWPLIMKIKRQIELQQTEKDEQ